MAPPRPHVPPRRSLRQLLPGPWDMAGLALATLIAAPAWFYPHGNDQALHWYLGQGILRGQLPFEHGISGKPLGIFLIHAIASGLLGPGQWAIRLAETLTLLGLAWMLPAIAAPARPRRDGALGASAIVICTLQYVFFDYWDVSHPETWIGLLMVGALRVAIPGRPSGLSPQTLQRAVVAVGALSGAAFMVKYTAAAIALPIAAYCGLQAMLAARAEGKSCPLALLKAAGLFLLGVAMVFALCVLPFWLGDALEPMWEVLYTLTVRYVGQAPGVPYTSLWIRPQLGGGALLASVALLLIGLGTHARGRRRGAVLRGLGLLVVALFAGLSVVIQGRYFSYHFMVLVPFLALLAHYGLAAIGAGHGLRAVLLASALAAVALVAEPSWNTHPKMSYAEHTERLVRYLRDEMPRRTYLGAFRGKNYLDHYWVHEHIGLQVEKRAQPGDQLCVRGFATGIYQVAGLRCPSRHVIQMWPAGLPQWEPEFWGTLKRTLPRFVVTFRDRPHEVKRLQRLGYHKHRMPSIFLLMERRQPAP